ncbi:MAG: hypothetical protein KatS3mg121_0074 [Gammaproteobacteria bacterium]|nr:MAG: hypothetical protein KatS3mg121_0074 [Gammaproteobacteria bacterium]
MRKRLLIPLGLAALAAVALAAWGAWPLLRPLPLAAPVTFELPAGQGGAELASRLHERGWLAAPAVLRAYLRVRDLDGRLKAGEYTVRPGERLVDLVDRIARGEVSLHAFTIVEGWTFAQLRRALRDSPLFTPTLAGLDDAAVMAALGRPGRHPEGWFLPETYHVARGSSDRVLLERALEAMERALEAVWAGRDPDLPLRDPYELLILASIVEKETAVPDERPLIAAVFVNRLRRGMRLQTDPTVIYGLGEAFDGNLRRADLRRDTPYNTYTRNGLPPTPIALPGRAALEAAAHPADSDVLYFVARGDGRHHFSRTLAEHNAAVDRYQRRRR